MNPYEPTHPRLCWVWKRLNGAMREERLAEARRREEVLKTVASRPKTESERQAIRQLPSAEDRSTLRRWQNRYRAYGFEGLVDWRLPPPPELMPETVRAAICTLRQADPNFAVVAIISHVAKHHGYEVGETKVKEVLRAAGLARRGGPPSGTKPAGEVRLELAGMKLVEAAGMQTGYMEALTQAMVAQLVATPVPASPSPVDTSGRDELGRFDAQYNERYRKRPGEAIGPGFASVEKTRASKDPARFHVNQVEPEILSRKIWALMVSPLLGTGRWDGIRVSRGALLGELCGYPYMPSTLDLFTRELKFVGMASTFWEVHARLWLSQTKAWGDPRSAAALYIDETNKPVWTDLFSQSSKVSHVGRVMPSLETVAFHSGYGVPLWQVTYSGRAPLVREVPPLLNRLEGVLAGAQVGRIVVIDAESNSIPFLKELESGAHPRGWITRLRPSWMEGKRVFNRTNYAAYRDGDRIRMGVADFPDPAGGTFRMRVIEIERRSKGTITYLGASTLLSERDWSAMAMGDLYFDRWPNQEANFRAVNQAVGAKDVHGYGKQLVDNVGVITELDKLQNELARLQAMAGSLKSERTAAQKVHHAEQTQLRRYANRLKTVLRDLDAAITRGARTTTLQRLNTERGSLQEEITRRTPLVARADKSLKRVSSRAETTDRKLEEGRARQETLNSRRHIFRHDVELDSLFAVFKVGLVLLVTLVLKEYLGDARMEPVTFLERLATLPGRLRLMPEMEIVTFEYNPRDPEVMALLAAHREAINALRLRTRSGRVLRIEIDPAPPVRRPPPPGARVNTNRRFAR